MKKLLFVLMVSVMSIAVLSACGNDTVTQAPKTSETQQTATHTTAQPQKTQTSQFIGDERAKEIALERAGLTETDVLFVKVDLDRDDGIWKYEIEFRQGRTEYETDIDATNGTILAWETDND